MTRQTYYHGSAVPGITVLEPRSRLRDIIAAAHHTTSNVDSETDSKAAPTDSYTNVLYLTTNIPYALVYIWDAAKTGSSAKWATCGIRGGVVIYEEQFPDQLKTFYQGVSGYLYGIKTPEALPCISTNDSFSLLRVRKPALFRGILHRRGNWRSLTPYKTTQNQRNIK